MHIRSTVQPGQRGAKKLLTQYGDRLVCVRYRYDEQRQKRLKTIELIIEEESWTPFKTPPPADVLVPLRIAPVEVTLRQQVKQVAKCRNHRVSRCSNMLLLLATCCR